MEPRCKYCNEPFYPLRYDQVFCCREHRLGFWANEGREARAILKAIREREQEQQQDATK